MAKYRLPRNRQDPQSVVTEAAWKNFANVEFPRDEFKLSRALFIPGGRDGFTINAQGTWLKSDGVYTGTLLAIGLNTTAGAATDSSIVNYAGRTVVDGAVARDATDPNVTGATAGYNVLSDPAVYTTYDNAGSPATGQVQRELVYLTSDSAFGRQPTRIRSGGTGQGHAYGATSYYIPVNAYASRNITINGLMLDGSNHPGGYADRLTSIWFVDGLVHDMKCQYFFNEGITTYFCRNKVVDVTHCKYSSGDSGGEGYAHADYGVFNAELYSSNGNGASVTPAFEDDGGATGIRHCWYKAWGVADCYQHDYRAHDLIDEENTPAIEVGSHVGPGEYCHAEDITLTGTARGVSGGGHQLFGYGDSNNSCSNIDANDGDFLMVACSDFDFDCDNVRNFVFVGWGDRSGVTTGAFPVDPKGCSNGTVSGSGQTIFTGTGFTANQERLEGTITLEDLVLNTVADTNAVRLRSEANCTIVFGAGFNATCNGTVFRVCDIGNGAGSITLTISGAVGNKALFALTDASNNREAFRLLTTGTVTGAANYLFTSAANPTPTFMVDSGTWSGEVLEPGL